MDGILEFYVSRCGHMKAQRIFLFLIALSAILPLADLGAQEAEGRVLSFATVAPPGSAIMRNLEAWNRELRRRTERRLQFRFYAGGVQGDEPELIRKIRSGRLDAAGVTASGLALIHRPALIFQLPGTFLRYEQVQAAREALASEIEGGIIQQGFRMLGWADVGRAHLFSKREIRKPQDLAQTKFWMRSDDVILPVFFEIVKAQTVSVGIPEVLGALQTGRIDTFFAPPAVALPLQWAANVTHMVTMPVAVLVGGSVMSERVFQSLPEADRNALLETGAQFHALGRRNAARAEEEAIAALRERGMKMVDLTPQEIALWKEVGKQVRERVATRIADPTLIAKAAAFGEK
ncbi:MAG: TRAP transporter substrate-binding protein DctP [Deltaproteobacteria bacterium]|nr:TRAP transporter substrate-binding protein DctP [Deltaproteobacteria bacterium]